MSHNQPAAKSFMARVRLDIACGLSLLTCLPVFWLLSSAQRGSTAPWPIRRSLWCWPVVGAAIGLLVGFLVWLLRLAHVAPLPAAGLALAAQCVLTGGLHEDGLADLADGCGGTTRQRRLEIMRDSRIGSYGVLALSLSLLVRASAIAALPADTVILALAISGCLARAVLLILPACLPPARPDGLARSLTPIPHGPFWLGLSLTGAILVGMVGLLAKTAGVLPPERLMLHAGFVTVGATLGACILGITTARKLLGGYTGDVLGAVAVLTECCILAAFTTCV